MKKQLIITTENEITNINTDMTGEELFTALVVLTGYVGSYLKDPAAISEVSAIACKDAMKLLQEKGLIPTEDFHMSN